MTAKTTGHVLAFAKWFLRYELERKKKHLSAGRTVPGLPPPPPGPDEVRRVIFNGINPIGERRAVALCHAHRTTVTRWLDGSVQIPGPAYSLLLFHADGIPPGCGEAWRGFSWHSDALTCPDGKTTLTAREIDGAAYQKAHLAALEDKCALLESQLLEMTRRVDWGSANDPYANGQDVRSRAFSL